MKVLDMIVKRTNGCAMFEFRNGKAYWLFNHHTKINPYKDALRVNLGKCEKPKHKHLFLAFGMFLYLTHTLQETIARNEASEKLNNKIQKQYAKRSKPKQPPIAGTSWDKNISNRPEPKRNRKDAVSKVAKKTKKEIKKGRHPAKKNNRRV